MGEERVARGPSGRVEHMSLLDALNQDADDHEAAGRVIAAANARAAVENLRHLPPWAAESSVPGIAVVDARLLSMWLGAPAHNEDCAARSEGQTCCLDRLLDA